MHTYTLIYVLRHSFEFTPQTVSKCNSKCQYFNYRMKILSTQSFTKFLSFFCVVLPSLCIILYFFTRSICALILFLLIILLLSMLLCWNTWIFFKIISTDFLSVQKKPIFHIFNPTTWIPTKLWNKKQKKKSIRPNNICKRWPKKRKQIVISTHCNSNNCSSNSNRRNPNCPIPNVIVCLRANKAHHHHRSFQNPYR